MGLFPPPRHRDIRYPVQPSQAPNLASLGKDLAKGKGKGEEKGKGKEKPAEENPPTVDNPQGLQGSQSK